ncbi:uncharacterized protein GIQ15_06858 [Arthroderma uncinatum]|uniref:uncharacterized protein n=1 Tax=Arthroderma uncinatum TaxID=74035 RepID=UPI00144AAF63|nr:uncharacterized protein GIQ15_06858 [Arthroderma uncinatum]KAF3479882.1 hypothetical protein GIQ15_06858 [Arthroderma uncinatum]
MICKYGERKKAQDKVYPKGYVEMLEEQQSQLVSGLQELYKLTIDGKSWPGSPLRETHNGYPLTHDILDRLGALRPEGPTNTFGQFEENLVLAQQRLMGKGAEMQRKDSSDGTSTGASSPSSSNRLSTGSLFSNEPFPPRLRKPQSHQVQIKQEQARQAYANQADEYTPQLNIARIQQGYAQQQKERKRQRQPSVNQPSANQHSASPNQHSPNRPSLSQPPNQPVYFAPMPSTRNGTSISQDYPWGLDSSPESMLSFEPQLHVEPLDQQIGQFAARHAAIAAGLNSCLPTDEFNEDEFNLYFDTNPNGLARI